MKVCFWGNIAKALNGDLRGGGELQLALLAKALARGGHEVVILNTDNSDDFITNDGIKVFKIKGWNKGIPFFRIFTHQMPQLYKSLLNQKADVYYCRIRDFRHILAYRAARKLNAKFILGVASDLDVLNFIYRVKYNYLVNRTDLWAVLNGSLTEIIYPFLLKKADMVLVQHSGQKVILQNKGIKSEIFPNIFDQFEIQPMKMESSEYFVYVGSLDKRKGFVEFYEIVKKAPNHRFKVVGSPRDKTAFLLCSELKKYPNVVLYGKLNHSETLNHIAYSKALISTSPMEGFPNVFIEAWAYGIPVLSLFIDPGDIIRNERLGIFVNGNMDIMLDSLNSIGNNNGFDVRSKTYVKQVHALTKNRISEISGLFSEPILQSTKN